MNSNAKSLILCVVLICLAVVVWMAVGNGRRQSKVTYSQFLQQVRAGKVTNVIIAAGNSGTSQLTCKLKDGTVVRTVLPSDYRDAIAAMQDGLVDIEIQESSWGWLARLSNAIPFLLLLGFWLFMMRRMQSGPGKGNLI